MIHYLDIRKTKYTDEGVIRCVARNPKGEAESVAQLKVNQKTDYRSVLVNPKTGGHYFYFFFLKKSYLFNLKANLHLWMIELKMKKHLSSY